jgi:hypothetical protein
VHIPKELRKKWDAKLKEHIMAGHSEVTKGYRLISAKNALRIVKAQDVEFIEEEF